MGFVRGKFVVLIILLFASCLNNKNEYGTLDIHIKLGADEENNKSKGVKVSAINQSNALSYVSYADERGNVSLDVEYGFYNIVAQHKDSIAIFNGRRERVLVNDKNVIVEDTLELNAASMRQPIIKEIYYSGCYTEAGKGYFNDQYIVLYNNAEYPIVLDSLCIGIVYPLTSNKLTEFINQDKLLMNKLPVTGVVWQFPGTGEDLILKPGEEVVIATNAINHRARHPKSVDLSGVDYAFWNQSFSSSMEEPAPGVIPLNMVSKKGTLNKFVFTISGSAIILFRLHGVDNHFFDDSNNLMKPPGKPNDIDYVMIPQEWVIDGVECANGNANVFKRLTSMVDAGYTSQKGNYTGVSVHRKLDKIKDGRVIYMDTNNSSMDFELVTPTLRSK